MDLVVINANTNPIFLKPIWINDSNWRCSDQSTDPMIDSTRLAKKLSLEATSHLTIFHACKYAIKDIDDVLPAKDGPHCPTW